MARIKIWENLTASLIIIFLIFGSLPAWNSIILWQLKYIIIIRIIETRKDNKKPFLNTETFDDAYFDQQLNI